MGVVEWGVVDGGGMRGEAREWKEKKEGGTGGATE